MRLGLLVVCLLSGCKDRVTPGVLDAQLREIKARHVNDLHAAELDFLSAENQFEKQDQSDLRYLRKMLRSVYGQASADPITEEELAAGLESLYEYDAPSRRVVKTMAADWANLTADQKTRLKKLIPIEIERGKQRRSRIEAVDREIDDILERFSQQLDKFETYMLKAVRNSRDMPTAGVVKYYSDTLASMYNEGRANDPVTEAEIRDMLDKLSSKSPEAAQLKEFLEERFKTSTEEQRTRIKTWLTLMQHERKARRHH